MGIKQSFRIGLFSLVAIIILSIFVVMQIGNSDGDRTIVAQFSESGGIKPGDAVEYAGVEVGHIESVELSAQNDIIMRFTVRENIPIYTDAFVTASNADLFGGMKLRLDIGQPIAGELSDEQPIHGVSPSAQGNIATDLTNLVSTTIEVIFRLGKTVIRIDSMMTHQFTPVFDQMDQIIYDAKNLLKVTNQYTTEIRAIEKLAGKSTITRVDDLLASFEKLIFDIDQLISRAIRRDGPLHKMVFTDSLYNQISKTIESADSLIQDVRDHPEHYMDHLDIQLRLFGGDNKQ